MRNANQRSRAGLGIDFTDLYVITHDWSLEIYVVVAARFGSCRVNILYLFRHNSVFLNQPWLASGKVVAKDAASAIQRWTRIQFAIRRRKTAIRRRERRLAAEAHERSEAVLGVLAFEDERRHVAAWLLYNNF